MLKYGNKEIRNLQEQVLQNAIDIREFRDTGLILANFGIKVVGQVADESDLPDPETYQGQYGDAYMVGSEAPFYYWIFTRSFDEDEPGNHWFNIGLFPAPGPQGEQGEQGPQGQSGVGSVWYYGNLASVLNPFDGDMILTPEGNVYRQESGNWVYKTNIKGPQGLTGQAGQTGPQGPIGPAGPQGPIGDTGAIAHIVGVVEDESELPDATLMQRGDGYLVGSAAPYELYVIVDEQGVGKQWFNIGAQGGFVIVELPDSASSGTLSEEQLSNLQSRDISFLKLDNELYILMDDQTESGYVVYTHVGQDSSSNVYVKNIAITLSTRGWTKVSNKVALQNTDVSFTKLKFGANEITKNAQDNIVIGTSAGYPCVIYGRLMAGNDSSYDLGSSSVKWRDLYLAGQLQIGSTTLSEAQLQQLLALLS